MVKWDGQMPTLLRIEPDEKGKVFYSGNFEYSGSLYWIFASELEDIADHKERFQEYSDISDEEAAKIQRQSETEYAGSKRKSRSNRKAGGFLSSDCVRSYRH